MKRFKNLLVVAPDDVAQTRTLLRAATDLAERNDASLKVFSTVEPIPEKRRFPEQGSRRIDLESLIIGARLDELKEAMPPTDVAVGYEVVGGVRYLETIDQVERYGHDLVITTPEAAPRRRGPKISSTTMHLLRKCPVPVWVHSPGRQSTARVAVAVGPLDAGEPTNGLNIKLLELGSSFASIRNAELHVIHAWRLEGETLLRGPRLSYNSSRIEQMAGEARDDADLGLRQLLAETHTSESAIVHLRKGHPSDVISDVVASVEPEIVVMGSVARTGIPGMIIGNTAERVLATLETSIMAVKPYGFVSPVEALKGWEPQKLPY